MSASTIYLNAAGTSWPKPAPVEQAVLRTLASDPADWAETFVVGHRRVADFFGVAAADDLLLTPGCTSALAVAISDHDWQAGDRILISGHEHLALLRPALTLRERGVEVIIAPPGGGGSIDLDFVKDTLRKGKVGLVAFSAASNVTGELAPISDLVSLARQHGALCLVDGAQVAGWLPIDVQAMGVDLFAFAGHKALHGPWGVGGLYIAPGVKLSTPRLESALERPGYCDGGSVDRLALDGLVAAMDWLSAPARSERLATARGHAATLWAALSELQGVTLHGPADPSARLPTVAMTCSHISPRVLGEALAKEGIITSAGQQCAPLAHRTLGTGAQGVLRMSVGVGTTAQEIVRTAEQARALALRRRA